MEFNDQLHAQAALTPRKGPRYLWNRRLGGPQSRSGRCGAVKKFSSAGIGTPNGHSRSLGHYTDGLFNLLDLECAFVQVLRAGAYTFSIFRVCNKTRPSITMFAATRRWSLSRDTRWSQSPATHTIALIFNSTLSSHFFPDF
jgi:hypothetical protein